MKDRYTLAEAASELGWTTKKIKHMADRGQIPVVRDMVGDKPHRFIAAEVLAGLKTDADYTRLLDRYIMEMQLGTITARRKPASEKTIKLTRHCLKRFWDVLELAPEIRRLNADNFLEFMARVGFDDVNHNDHYALKENTRKAITGFMRLLVREGLKTQADIDAIHKPARKYEREPDFYSPRMIQTAIDVNRAWIHGRSRYDADVMDVLIHLYAYQGLRRMEAANLLINDIDLAGNKMKAWGKGGKRREIPLFYKVRDVLKEWIEIQRPESDLPYLLVQADGSQLTESSIGQKFVRFSTHFGQRIHAHGLRHSCATLLDTEGCPLSHIQWLLGHSSRDMTEHYIHRGDFFQWFAAYRGPVKKTKKPAPARRRKPVIC